MILPQLSSPSTTTVEYFLERHSPRLTIHFSPNLTASAEEEACGATTSSMQTTSSQPINILQPKPRVLHYNTAPTQMTRLCGMLETSEEEERPRIVLPKKAVPIAPPPAKNIRNNLCLYRERILNEVMRRRLLEAEREEENMQESDKENSSADANRSRGSRKRLNSQMSTDCCDYNLEGTSTNNLCNNNYMGFSELDDGIASADDESDVDDCAAQVPDISAGATSSNFWGDTDDDALMPMPTTFHSIGDIIGYAKVVRAQRNEALGKLNSVIGQFSDALAVYSTSTLRMQDTINNKT